MVRVTEKEEAEGQEKGGKGGSCPPTFESWGVQPLQFFTSTHAPFLTGPPSSQLAPTPLWREGCRGRGRIKAGEGKVFTNMNDM